MHNDNQDQPSEGRKLTDEEWEAIKQAEYNRYYGKTRRPQRSEGLHQSKKKRTNRNRNKSARASRRANRR